MDARPAIKGPTGGRAGSLQIKVRENENFVYEFDLNRRSTTWKQGGEDADLFRIKSKSGKLYFKEKPNFEYPQDIDRDNIYEVVVRVEDKDTRLSSYQYVNVEVVNVKESGPNDGQVSDDPSTQEDGIDQDTNQEEGQNEGEGSNEDSDPSADTEVQSTLVKNIGSGSLSSNPNNTTAYASQPGPNCGLLKERTTPRS